MAQTLATPAERSAHPSPGPAQGARFSNPPRHAWLGAILLGVLPYLNSLNAFWVGDDYNYVVPKTLPTILNFFNPVGRAAYRPLNWLTWALDYELYGAEPLGWKLTSLLLHLITCALIFLFTRELVRAWIADSAAAARGPLLWLPALVTALFAVHPAHPETVTWTGGRADVAFAPWLFLAAWAFLRWRREGGKGWYALAFAGVLGAVLGKEAGLVAAPALLITDVAGLGRAWRGRRNAVRLFKTHVAFFAVPVLYVLMRLYLFLTGQGRLMYGVDTHLQFGEGLIDSAVGYMLLALGWWEAPHFIHGWPLPVKLGLLLAGLGVALFAVRRLGRPALFALLWMPITVAVTYEQATPRWFYAGSFGAALLAGLALVALAGSRRFVATALTAAVVLIAGWSLATAEYNVRWYESGEVARGLIEDIRGLHPDPPRPATFYMGNAPYSHRNVLLFNSGFGQAASFAYQDYVQVRGYELKEHRAQVDLALRDPSQLGPNPFYLRYEDGRIVEYPSLQALVAAEGR